jgi:zinc protease
MKHALFVLIFLLAANPVFLAPPVAAQSGQPTIGPRKPIILPQTSSFTLENGLVVTLAPFGATPKMSATLVLRSGVLDENGLVGVADMTAALMNEGSAGLSAPDVARRAADMGASVGTSAGMEAISVSVDGLSEFAPQLIQLLADAALKPNMPASELPRLQADVNRNFMIELATPSSLASKTFGRMIYPGHPFGDTLMTPDRVARFSLDNIKAYYDRAFVANRARLYLAGQFDPAAVEQAIRSGFSAWAKGSAPVLNPPQIANKTAVTLVDQMDAPQTVVIMGLPAAPVGSPDQIAQNVMDELLGGAFFSRITRNIREDKGYTYTPSTAIADRYKVSTWQFQADIATGVTGAAISEVLKEMDQLRKTPPSDDELQRVKNYMTGTFILGAASRQGMIRRLSTLDFHEQPYARLSSYTADVEAVTGADIKRVATAVLKPERLSVAAVGDIRKIKPQFQKIRLFRGKITDTSELTE